MSFLRGVVIAAAVFVLATAVAKERIVFFGAHPDDTEGFAGTAFLLKDAYELHVVDFTRGELGLGRRGLEDGSTAKRRVAEEKRACALLGATPHFLDEIDGTARASQRAYDDFVDLLRELRPRAVFAHWPADRHPDHINCAATAVSVVNRLAREGLVPEFYFYEVLAGETEQFPMLYSVDITRTMDRKTDMLRCYECQNENDSLAQAKIRQAALRGAERTPPVRFAEVFTTFDGKPVVDGLFTSAALRRETQQMSGLAPYDEKSFVSIFNGRDLTGWEGATNTYYVSDSGELVCGQKGGFGDKVPNLWTVRDYTNFVIRFQVKLPENANNGLGLRTRPNGHCSTEGMEIQLLDDFGFLYGDGPKAYKLRPNQYCGAIYNVVAPRRGLNGASYLRPTGEWNDMEVMADGYRIRVVLNGTVVVDDDVSQYFDEGPKPLQGEKRPGLRNTFGRLHWCGHGYDVRWRNIRICEL